MKFFLSCRNARSLSSESLLSKRMVWIDSSESKTLANVDTPIPLEELTFAPDQLDSFAPVMDRVRLSVRNTATDLHGKDGQEQQSSEEEKPSKLVLSNAGAPQAMFYDKGYLVLMWPDGMLEHYRNTSGTEWETIKRDTGEASLQSSHFGICPSAQAPLANIRSQVHGRRTLKFKERDSSTGYSSVQITGTAFKIESDYGISQTTPTTKTVLRAGKHRHTLLDDSEAQLGPLKKTTVRSSAADGTVLMAIDLEFESTSRQILLFTNSAGELIFADPSDEKPFPTAQVSPDIACYSLGNQLLVRSGDHMRRVMTPAISDLTSVETIGTTSYLTFNRVPTGQVVIALDKETGELVTERGTDGIFAAEGIAIDASSRRLYTMSSKKGRIKTIQVQDISDGDEPEENGEVQQLTEDDVNRALGAIQSFEKDFPPATAEESVDTFKARRQALESLFEVVEEMGSARKTKPMVDNIKKALELLSAAQTLAESRERHRRSAVGKLNALDERFFEKDMPSLRKAVEGNLGSHIERVVVYTRKRNTDRTERERIQGDIPEERWAASEAKFEKTDAEIEVCRERLGARALELVADLKKHGQEYLMQLVRASSYEEVRNAQESFETKGWTKVLELLTSIQTPGSLALPRDGKYKDVMSALDAALIPHKSGVGPGKPEDDVEDRCQKIEAMNLGDIERYRDQLFRRACSEHADQEALAIFDGEMNELGDLLDQVLDAGSTAAIEKGIQGLWQQFEAVQKGIYKEKWLRYHPPSEGKVDRFRLALESAHATAMGRLNKREHLKEKAFVEQLERHTAEFCRRMQSRARLQGEDLSELSPFEQARQATNSVLELIKGFNLYAPYDQARDATQKHCSDSLASLIDLLVRLEKEFENKKKANEIWQSVRKSLQRCWQIIRGDQASLENPGYVTLKPNPDLNGCREHPIAPVLLERGGRQSAKPLEVLTTLAAQGGRPVIELSLIGDKSFQVILPDSNMEYNNLPAYYWESPEGAELNKLYNGPQISREEIAAVMVLEWLAEADEENRRDNLKKTFVDPDMDDRARLDEWHWQLGAFMDEKLVAAKGFELDRRHRDNVIRIVMAIFKSQDGHVAELTAVDGGVVVEELHYTHSRLEEGKLTIDPAKLKSDSDAFVNRYGKHLDRIHKRIRMNVEKAELQLGLGRQKEALELPVDYNLTNLGLILMNELQAAIQLARSEPDKGMVLFLSDVGLGKSTLAMAYYVFSNSRAHMFDCASLAKIRHLDPFAEFADSKSTDIFKSKLKTAEAQQLFLLAATLILIEAGMILDEGPLLSDDLWNSLIKATDFRMQYDISTALDPYLQDPDYAQHTVDFYANGVNRTREVDPPIVTGNYSYKRGGQYVDTEISEQIRSRSAVLDGDVTAAENPFDAKADFIIRGSADLQLYPEDLCYIVSRRLSVDGFDRSKAGVVDKSRLVTELSDAQLERVVEAIDMRCLAAEINADLQNAWRRTQRHQDNLKKLGEPACWTSAIGPRDAKALLPRLKYPMRYGKDGQAVKDEVYSYHKKTHLNDRGTGKAKENLLRLAYHCQVWTDVTEAEWGKAMRQAKRDETRGDSGNEIADAAIGMHAVMDEVRAGLFGDKDTPTRKGEMPNHVFGLLQRVVVQVATVLEAGGGPDARDKHLIGKLDTVLARVERNQTEMSQALQDVSQHLRDSAADRELYLPFLRLIAASTQSVTSDAVNGGLTLETGSPADATSA